MAIKTGAEGVFVAIMPEQRLGVALKIADGATRRRECAIAAILVKLGAVDPAHTGDPQPPEPPPLQPLRHRHWRNPPRRGAGVTSRDGASGGVRGQRPLPPPTDGSVGVRYDFGRFGGRLPASVRLLAGPRSGLPLGDDFGGV